MNFEAIFNEAKQAARDAVDACGPENTQALNCGFAWCTISGTEPLARWARKMRKERIAANDHRNAHQYGDKGYPTGWQFWNPGEFAGQQIEHKEAGARAFRDVLARHNIRADVGSRYD